MRRVWFTDKTALRLDRGAGEMQRAGLGLNAKCRGCRLGCAFFRRQSKSLEL